MIKRMAPLVGAMALFVVGTFWVRPLPTIAAPPPVNIGGPFTLMAMDGRTVTDHSLAGKWLLIYFGYTFCPDACPTALANISDALEKLGPEADRLQPLFITVDPERDTPAVLSEYLQAFDPRIL